MPSFHGRGTDLSKVAILLEKDTVASVFQKI